MSHLHSANFSRKQLNNSIYINHAILVVITPGHEEKNEWDVIWLFCHFPPRILEPVWICRETGGGRCHCLAKMAREYRDDDELSFTPHCHHWRCQRSPISAWPKPSKGKSKSGPKRRLIAAINQFVSMPLRAMLTAAALPDDNNRAPIPNELTHSSHFSFSATGMRSSAHWRRLLRRQRPRLEVVL